MHKMVIGLEVHVQLNTNTKVFCGCATSYTDQPNVHVCPVCLAHPGALPVLNKSAVKKSLYAALATNCKINHHSLFDRKSYTYPDLPKGYQITQFYSPICEQGYLDVEKQDGSLKRIRINHIHLEEDAGKLVHGEGARSGSSFVDLNRAGMPLLEIVSEADISSADEAVLYATKLRQILMYAGVTDGNMQEGSIRFDVNLSIMKPDAKEFGTRTETKNLNSFTALRKSIEMEYDRQVDLLEDGKLVVQETRLFNIDKMESRSLRIKGDGEQGYLYFRDPDIPALLLSDEELQNAKDTLPLLPDYYIDQLMNEYGIKKDDAIILTQEQKNVEYFQKMIVGNEAYAQKIANFFLSDMVKVLRERKMSIEDVTLEPQEIGKIFPLIEKGTISLKIAKDLINDMIVENKSIETLMNEKGMVQISNESELQAIIQKILDLNPDNVKQYKEGKVQLMGFFVGQVMKESSGKANPSMVNSLLKKMLEQ